MAFVLTQTEENTAAVTVTDTLARKQEQERLLQQAQEQIAKQMQSDTKAREQHD